MLHVSDAVSVNLFCMNYDGVFGGQHYDAATGNNISLNEIKEIVLKYHPEVIFDYVEDRAGDVFSTRANTGPLRELGWETKVDITTGINECFNF